MREIVNRKSTIIDGEKFTLNLVDKWDSFNEQLVGKKLLEYVIDNKEPIRYGELAKLVGNGFEAHFIDRCFGAISYSCIESGLPPVSVIVVGEDGLPGAGFFKEYYPNAKSFEEKYKIALEAQKKVFEYGHWDIILKLFNGNK